MEDKNLKLWQAVVAISSLAVVVGSLVYWLYGNVGGTQPLSTQENELNEKVIAYESEIEELKSENLRLKNMPAKEVEVEKECPACPECKPEIAVGTAQHECPKCEESTTKIGEFSIGKPVSVASMVCTKMEIGKWDMPATCAKELQGFLGRKLEANGHFFVVTPIVDTRQYKGKQPELKQAGLGQFRANKAKTSIKELAGPNIAVFQKNVIQKKEMRGFIVELYQVENYK